MYPAIAGPVKMGKIKEKSMCRTKIYSTGKRFI